MKVAIAQLNPVVGDIRGNLEKIRQTLIEYGPQTDLIVFSELFLTGYPPQDLVERPGFIARVEAALEQLLTLSKAYPDTGILVGAPLPRHAAAGKPLTNSALLIADGALLLNQPKSLLPTYDVFDEARYFQPAEQIRVVEFKGEILGITVCEDAWNDEIFWPSPRLYSFDPVQKLAAAGASLLINISASPFHGGKDELRYRMISSHVRRHGIPFIFVNQVGGNDELIFDGGSMVFDGQGKISLQLPFFEEKVVIHNTALSGRIGDYRPLPVIQGVYQALVLGIRDYFKKCGVGGAVIGLSGGIDSALTCCLAVAALGKENVLGISMPSPYSSPGSVDDSRKLAESLGIVFQVIPISAIFETYLAGLAEPFAGREPDVTEENIQARIRGNILMAFSNKLGYLTLSTGNKSELAVGYCTLYGDMCGGLSVISDVPKTMVYELSDYVNREREIIPRAIVDKEPSAELKPDQRDQDTLPPYPVLDRILQSYIEEGRSAAEIIAQGFDGDTVRWVIGAVNRNEYKRRQAAPGLKVTSKAFGGGRRIPIAKKLTIE